MNERPATVVMVCTGNICRSPAMHYFAQREWGDAAEVSSAGIQAEIGMDVPTPMRTAARRHALDIPAHRPTQLDGEIIADADLVLVATQQHATWIEEESHGWPSHAFGIREAHALTEHAEPPMGASPRERLLNAAASLHLARTQQPVELTSLDDPWSLDQDTYDRVMDEIAESLDALTLWARLADR
ncbi:low molecular weight phosphatase family protein [Demequina sp. SO4-18]|uniref:arsenate-mycothiol transferase ArsC n=1 Tax=Demequina sp. SO4-18 TaxID=3401026 RepID=UPI003B58CC7F